MLGAGPTSTPSRGLLHCRAVTFTPSDTLIEVELHATVPVPRSDPAPLLAELFEAVVNTDDFAVTVTGVTMDHSFEQLEVVAVVSVKNDAEADRLAAMFGVPRP